MLRVGPAFLPPQFEKFPSSGFYFGMSHPVVLLLPPWLGGKRRLRVREVSIVTFDRITIGLAHIG